MYICIHARTYQCKIYTYIQVEQSACSSADMTKSRAVFQEECPDDHTSFENNSEDNGSIEDHPHLSMECCDDYDKNGRYYNYSIFQLYVCICASII